MDPAFDVKLVVTQPDKPVGRGKKVSSPPVKVTANTMNIPILQPANVNEELPAYLAAHPQMKPDFLIVVAYGEILSQAVLDLPNTAAVNVHGSILPRWRGASPIEHAILAGDTETGVTVQMMVAQLDAGAVLATASFPVGARDTARYVRQQLSQMGPILLTETLNQPLYPVPQPSKGVTFCRKLSKEDGLVDRAKMTADDIDRHVRALNPWPGVTCEVQGHTLKLIETSLDQVTHSMPVSCANETTLHLVRVQPAGKKEMNADEWRRGLR